MGGFRIVGPHDVAYLDLVGSGAETIAHLRENRRIVVMFCAFEGPPRIVRLHGRGDVLEPGQPGFDELLREFEPPEHGLRSLIRVHVERIADSCGYLVPRMRYEAERPQHDAWVDKQVRDEGGLEPYVAARNRESIDGLPAVRR
jgi:hypothetical protein